MRAPVLSCRARRSTLARDSCTSPLRAAGRGGAFAPALQHAGAAGRAVALAAVQQLRGANGRQRPGGRRGRTHRQAAGPLRRQRRRRRRRGAAPPPAAPAAPAAGGAGAAAPPGAGGARRRRRRGPGGERLGHPRLSAGFTAHRGLGASTAQGIVFIVSSPAAAPRRRTARARAARPSRRRAAGRPTGAPSTSSSRWATRSRWTSPTSSCW